MATIVKTRRARGHCFCAKPALTLAQGRGCVGPIMRSRVAQSARRGHRLNPLIDKDDGGKQLRALATFERPGAATKAVDAAMADILALTTEPPGDQAYCRRDNPSNLHERCIALRHCVHNSIAVAPSRYSDHCLGLSTGTLEAHLPTLRHFRHMLLRFVLSAWRHAFDRFTSNASVESCTAVHGARLYLG